MKRIILLLLIGIFSIGIVTGCSSDREMKAEALDSKHEALPDYVLKSSGIVQDTYVMAANNPEVLASVPCYCNCYESGGHISNLDCFVAGMGSDNEVTNWDPHGIA